MGISDQALIEKLKSGRSPFAVPGFRMASCGPSAGSDAKKDSPGGAESGKGGTAADKQKGAQARADTGKGGPSDADRGKGGQVRTDSGKGKSPFFCGLWGRCVMLGSVLVPT